MDATVIPPGLKSLHEIARPTIHILNSQGWSIVRLKPHLRSWLVAVMPNGIYYVVEASTKEAARDIMRGYALGGRPNYLIYVQQKNRPLIVREHR